MDFSFVIRTYNEGKYIRETLERIEKQKGNFSKEVIIVDSESTDNTVKIAEEYNCKIIKIPQKNWSWGKALNTGIEKAKGEFIVILSGHSFIKGTDFLINAKKFFDKYEKLAAVYGKQFPILGMNPLEEFEYRNYYPDIDEFIMTNPKKKLIGISNACAVIKKKVWEENKYNEEVQSLEDSLWTKEVLKKGYTAIYTDKIKIYHSHIFNVPYLYKRFYWFIYYNLLEGSNPEFSSFKHKVRRYIKIVGYRYYLYFNKIYNEKKMKQYFKEKGYHIDEGLMKYYLKIKYTATINAFKDFCIYKENHPADYITLEVPEGIKELEKNLHIDLK